MNESRADSLFGIVGSVFYVSRMISSQKERDFSNSNYNDIKRVYSIWVCMNMPENSLEHIHLVKDSIVNFHAWKGKMDLINIVMIGLAEELPKHEEKYELHRLLGALLSQDLTVNEKLDIIGNEYAIPIEKDFREDVSIMCNLSQGIKEAGIAEGREAGIAEGKQREIEKVILFGSYARHEATLVSDVDFCIVSPKMKGIKFFSLKGDLEETLFKNVDIFQLHCIEVNSPIYKNIFKEGLTIYSKEN